jgi:hypothetical protein
MFTRLRRIFRAFWTKPRLARRSSLPREANPVAKLVPLTSPHDRSKRRLGALAGVAVVPPDFDAPLPDHVIDTFEGR